MVLLVNGLIGVFALKSAENADIHERALQNAVVQAVDSARESQVAFKVQVQEWKNLLLRGFDDADRDTFMKRFVMQEEAVGRELARFAANAATVGVGADEVERLRAEHAALGKRYRDALAGFDPADPLSPRAVDRAVRGIDRPLDQSIDALSHAALERSQAIQQDLDAAASARFGRMRTIALATTITGIALIGALLFVAMRRR